MSKLPPQWAKTTVGELATDVRYGSSSKTSTESSGVPVLRMGNIIDGNLDFEKLKYLPVDHEEFPALLLDPGDVLFNRTNSAELVGKTAVYNGNPPKCSFASYLIRIRLNGALPAWLSFYLNCPLGKSQIKSDVSQNVGQANVNGTKLKGFWIPLPPLPEQKRIVAKIEELFSELDAGEESLRRARRQLGVYRQSLLKQAFEGKLTAPWRTQNPNLLESPDQLLSRIQAEREARHGEQLGDWECSVKEWKANGEEGRKPTKPKTLKPIVRRTSTETDSIPTGWLWLNLGDASDVTGGLTKNSKRDSLSLRIPYLRVANVYANELRLEEIKDIGVTQAEARKVRLAKGDLLIVEGNGSLEQIGRVASWNGSIEKCGHQNHLIRSRCFPSANHSFVLMFLLSPQGRERIEKQAASTSGLHTLSVSKVHGLSIPLCSLPEQQEIVRLLDEQFEVIEQNEREIDAALKRSEALRQSILKKAFTGQLVPQDPTVEPASTLLARIQQERSEREAAAAKKRTTKKSAKKRARKPNA